MCYCIYCHEPKEEILVFYTDRGRHNFTSSVGSIKQRAIPILLISVTILNVIMISSTERVVVVFYGDVARFKGNIILCV